MAAIEARFCDGVENNVCSVGFVLVNEMVDGIVGRFRKDCEFEFGEWILLLCGFWPVV